MRVLLSTIGSRGDVQPLVALALQLRTLGQEVRMCVPPDFRDWIEGLGLSLTTIGPELRRPGSQPRSSPIHAGATTPADGRHGHHAIRDGHGGSPGLRHHCGGNRPSDRHAFGGREEGHPLHFCRLLSGSPALAASRAPGYGMRGQTPAPATADNRELWARDAAATMTCSVPRSIPFAHPSAWPRSAMCAATSSPTVLGWQPTRSGTMARSRGPDRVSDRRLDPAG